MGAHQTRFEIRSGEDLGRTIAQRRRDSEMDQTGLAELAGLSKAYISKIESGRTVSLLEHHLRILRRLGATITVEFPDDD